MPLTDAALKNAKATDKPLKLFDGGGLFLLVMPSGGKWWRLKYRFDGKEKLLSLGTYPDVPLAGHKDKKTGEWIDGAREKRDHARKLIKQAIDPGVVRKTEKAEKRAANASTFEAVAREWHALPARKGRRGWSPATAAARLKRLESDVFPAFGGRPISEIRRADIEKLLKAIDSRGHSEVARRVQNLIERIFRYASRDDGPLLRNPAVDLSDILSAAQPKHHAAITEPKAVGALMRAIRGYTGEPVTRAALQLAPLVFVRPGELRGAEWSEFDLAEAVWRIPAERMKMKNGHVVPLSRQAVQILRDLEPHTGRCRLVFPSVRSRARPISENTLNGALRRLGFTSAEMTSHGFRTMASTLLNEQGWHHDAIERQLAHVERNEVRAAYNRAEHLPERRRMMQYWSDYLDGLAAGADVVPMRAGKKN